MEVLCGMLLVSVSSCGSKGEKDFPERMGSVGHRHAMCPLTSVLEHAETTYLEDFAVRLQQ